MINLLVGGDLCPIGKNLPYFINGNADVLFNDLLPYFCDADLSIVNLECPLINESKPIKKNGPVIGVESACINGINKAKIDVLNLANNHIMDHGKEGLANTLQICSEVDIATVGAGKDLDNARQILIKEVKGIRIGIIAVAEHEFSIAKENLYGANPLDLIDYVRVVKRQRDKFDYLVVLVHGGNELYPLPSPRLRDTCRFFVEMGANAVIVQHTHCSGCYEQYNGAYIVYGQGNFIFDIGENQSGQWNKGFLVQLEISDKDNHVLNLIPLVQSHGNIGAQKMPKELESEFLKEINERSSKLADSHYIQQEWLNFCNEREDYYYSRFLPTIFNNRLFGKLSSYFPFAKRLFSEKHFLRIENVIQCESHREVLETIFSKRKDI